MSLAIARTSSFACSLTATCLGARFGWLKLHRPLEDACIGTGYVTSSVTPYSIAWLASVRPTGRPGQQADFLRCSRFLVATV